MHTCALEETGQAFCWGNNDYNQLGAESGTECGGRPCSTTPRPAGGALRFVDVASGWVHNCGISVDGGTYCWGGGAMDRQGFLGDGSLRRSAEPVLVATDSAFRQVTVGDAFSCALTAGGMAFCWGENDLGQLGDGSRADRATPVAVATSHRFMTIAAGAQHTCGITLAQEAFCWGDNRWGQLGSGNVAYNSVAASRTMPVAVAGDSPFIDIVAGWEHSCALTATGIAHCWGRNDDARQLGDDSGITHRGVPGPVSASAAFSRLSAGALATCGITAGGESWCWGANYYGALGDGTTAASGVGHPVRTRGGPFADVALGQAHACGIGTDRRLWCWGDRSAGQF